MIGVREPLRGELRVEEGNGTTKALLPLEPSALSQHDDNTTGLTPAELQEKAFTQLYAWLADWEHLPHAALIAQWLVHVAPGEITALPPISLYPIARYAFHSDNGHTQCPDLTPLYTILSVDPPTVQQVCTWYLTAALVVLQGEISVQDALEFANWLDDDQWKPWSRFGRGLLAYVRQGGLAISAVEQLINGDANAIDGEAERIAARDLLVAITASGYFDFKKGQRLSLIMYRELAWLRQDLNVAKPSVTAVEWAKTLRVEPQIDRWAAEAEPRRVQFDGKRRQGLLRDLQALRNHIERWNVGTNQQTQAGQQRPLQEALKRLADEVYQEQAGWRRNWATSAYPALSAWCELLLQSIEPYLARIELES